MANWVRLGEGYNLCKRTFSKNRLSLSIQNHTEFANSAWYQRLRIEKEKVIFSSHFWTLLKGSEKFRNWKICDAKSEI